MSAYIQMGNASTNLIGETGLDCFRGIILSPVNEEQNSMAQFVARIRALRGYDILLDPQLYFPRSHRGQLSHYPYFPKDLDSADLNSDSWWNERAKAIADFAKGLEVHAVASPAVHPNGWNEDFYKRCADTSAALATELTNTNIRVLSTVMVEFNSIQSPDEALNIASLVSESDPAGYYIVLSTNIEPRRELASEDALLGMMKLVKALEDTGRPVLVSHCSSEMLLYKVAGASHCATGKYFNLRRYTPSRYEENEDGGGGQAAYWFEQSLLGFLRLADVLRLRREDNFKHLVGTGFSDNHWSRKIIENFTLPTPPKGVREGWRQYMCWFGQMENHLSNNDAATEVRKWLEDAERNWLQLQDAEILFDEPRNSGSWLRPWRQASIAFLKNN